MWNIDLESLYFSFKIKKIENSFFKLAEFLKKKVLFLIP